MSNDACREPLPLHDDVKAVVWRIFGHGASPLTEPSSYKLIKRVVAKRCESIPPTQQRSDIAKIQGCFISEGDHVWLRPDRSECVAVLILEGIDIVRRGTAVWAIGSIDAALAARLMRTHWPTEKIETFIDAALQTLEDIRHKGKILDSTRLSRLDYAKVEIPEEAFQKDGRLQTFSSLENRGLDLVVDGLPPAVGNLVELLVMLWTEEFGVLVDKLDHPVMQARAARHSLFNSQTSNHREPLGWIIEDSCDAVVALAMVHTLKTVNKLDHDLRIADRRDTSEHSWATELRPPQDDLDLAATQLLTDLVERLDDLGPLESVRWIGELLSGAPSVLHPDRDHDPPRRVRQLTNACTDMVARLVQHAWSDDFVPELCTGLCLTPDKRWTRHLADTAWKARSLAPAQAIEIARATLREHERQLTDQGKYKNLYVDWSRKEDQAWIEGLGTALALSREDLDLPGWISAQCRALPLSVWDAEDDVEAFMAADRVAIHWFLVAFAAIPRLKQLGRPTNPAAVRILAEALWRHRQFVGSYTHHSSNGSVAEEIASRCVIEFGEPSDTWLLARVRDKAVGPLSLFGLIDQRQLKAKREGGTESHYDEMFRADFVEVATSRFVEGERFTLEALRFWGSLWRALGAPTQARGTARAIVGFPLGRKDRPYKIAALKLFAFAASQEQLDPASSEMMKVLYNELWSPYTHAIGEEKDEREEIGMLLEEATESLH